MQIYRYWTIYETLFLKKYAGAVPLPRLACDLNRSISDVVAEAERLELSTEYVGTRLYLCPKCASWSAKLASSGWCRKCDIRKLNERREKRMTALLALLPTELRDMYASTEALRAPRKRDLRPVEPCTADMSPQDAVAAETAYLAALEDWEYRQEFRRGKAIQKRIERITANVKKTRIETVEIDLPFAA